jgi:NAD(P)-dependent dehydrogenase (short-subunit alcohol dehydrogenase family)
MGKLDGKIAVVTGAAGGIGLASAQLFAREGAKVLLVDRDEESLGRAQSMFEGAAVASFAADVSSPEDTASYVDECVRRFGGIDVIFANAGIEGTVTPVTEYTPEDFDRVLAVNVRGTFLAIRAGAPHIAKRGGGSIVLTSSVAGVIGSAGLSAYVASKHAVIGLAKCAAIELAPLGIRVNTLNPGPIENRMMQSIEEQASPGHGDEVKQAFLAKVPMGRYGTNEEMARMALFLASSDSSYCTGAVFMGDGGFVAG